MNTTDNSTIILLSCMRIKRILYNFTTVLVIVIMRGLFPANFVSSTASESEWVCVWGVCVAWGCMHVCDRKAVSEVDT